MKHLKKGLFALAIIAAFLMGACSVGVVSAEQNHPLKIWKQNENGDFMTLNVVDEKTGVNYVVVAANTYGGWNIAITPRLNADETLYVTP